MTKDFVVKAKTYVVKDMTTNRYLDHFGLLSPYSETFTETFDTKKKAQLAYRNGKTSATCIIIEAGDRKKYEI